MTTTGYWIIAAACVGAGVGAFAWNYYNTQQKIEQAKENAQKRIALLAQQCWESYNQLLLARGQADKCANFLEGDGGVAEIASRMQEAMHKYADNPEKLAMMLRDRDITALINLSRANGFYSPQKGWGLPSSKASGFEHKQNYMESIGCAPGLNPDPVKLQAIDSRQRQEARTCREAKSVAKVKSLLPTFREMSNPQIEDLDPQQLSATAQNFITSINNTLHESSLQ